MSAPVPVSETYTSCVGSTFTIGTSPDTVVLKVIEGGYTYTVAVDEMTNSGSGGAYEDVATIESVKGSFTCAYVSGDPIPAGSGKIYNTVIANSAAPQFSGNARYNNVNVPIMNVKDGLKYKFDIMSQGAFTVS